MRTLTNREQLTILGLAIAGGLALQIGLSLSLKQASALLAQKTSARRHADYPQGAPIPNGPDVPSDKQFCPIYRAWLQRIAVAEYEKTPGANKEVTAFLEDGISYLIGLNVQGERAAAAKAEALDKAGIKDPIFQLFAGLVVDSPARKQAFFCASLAGLKKTSHPKFLSFMAAANLAKALKDEKAPDSALRVVDNASLKYLAEGLNPADVHEQEMPALRWRLCGSSVDSLIIRRGDDVANVVEGSSAVPPWLSSYFSGRRFLKQAWNARGGGWSSTVSDAGWNGWAKNLAFARERLTRSWELNPKDPAAAADMIEVSMGDGTGKREMRRWFDRAVAAQMDFPHAYTNFAWGLRPRWLGSHEEMLMFGRECLATNRYDTCVPYYYINFVREVASEETDHNAIYKRPEIVGPVRSTLAAYLSNETCPFSKHYGHTLAAIVAYKSGDLNAAKAEMTQVQFQPDPAPDLYRMENLPEMLRQLGVEGGIRRRHNRNDSPQGYAISPDA